MSKKKRSKSRFSSFSKLFKRNETPYPAALDGQVTPWITISNAQSHPLKKVKKMGQNKPAILRVTDFETRRKKTKSHQNIKLSPLDMQLKKMRLLIILKNNKPLKKIALSQMKISPISGFSRARTGVILRHKTKILAS